MIQLYDLDESRASAVRFHVLGVSRQNLTSTIAALEKYMSTPSQAGATANSSNHASFSRFVLATCMSSALGDRTPRDEKFLLLKELVQKALDRENAITLVADIFDLSGGTMHQNVDKIYNELLLQKLSLSRLHQVLFAIALTFASGEGWREVGQQVLVRVLDGQNPEDVKALLLPNHEHHLLHFSMTVAQIPFLRKWADALWTVVPLAPRSSSTAPEPFPLPVNSTLDASCSIAKVVEELGPVCIATPDDLKELFDMFPASAINERGIAELLSLLASPSRLVSQEINTYHSLRVSMGLQDHKSSAGGVTAAAAPPQTNVVVQAIKELHQLKEPHQCREYWNRVVLALDQPTLRVERFATIAAAYKKGTNEQLPVALFLNDTSRRWRNTAIQAAALKFALDNPELVGRDALKASAASAATAASPQDGQPQPPTYRVLPKDIKTPEDVSDLWRVEAFADTVAAVSTRERDLDAVIQAATAKAPAALIAALLGCPTPSVRHFVLAAQALRSAANLATAVTPAVAQYLAAESCVPALVGLLSELSQFDATRVFDIAELVVKLNLTDAVIKCSPCTRLVVEVAICGRECNQTPEKWLEHALSDANRSRPNQAHSKFSVANSVLEAADDLLTRQRYVGSATAALQALMQSTTATASFPGIVAHAKVLLQGDNAFSADVEEEATQFFTRIYADDTVAPMTLIDRLYKNSSASPRDKQVLACIINILFEETRTLADYPWKQLQTAARLFGQLINSSDVLGPTRLEQALRLLLPTILKQTDMKTYEYGMIALEQFKMRLLEWPAVGKQLKAVVDLDMRIPGIVGIISLGIQRAAAEEDAKNGGGDKATADAATQRANQTAAANVPAAGSAALALHQLDIRILMDNTTVNVAPPSVVQDQINFVVGNTDPSNIDSSAADLAALLKSEFHGYFADYLVVKRVSLEPNFHRMYLQLVEKMNSKELEKRIRTATVVAVKRLLASEKIRTDTSERSLLKNLGSWLGCITLAKNIPVLARELDFKEMLYQGLREGKLIAVVPFIAKVLDQCVSSRYFRPPNPWTMAQVGHLYEIYRLPDLKLTLRFEVEVLCKNINISVHDVEEVTRAMYPTGRRTGMSMEEIRNTLDISGSTDFRVEESRQESPPPKPRGLQADAAPYQPRAAGGPAQSPAAAPVVDVQPPPRQPVEINAETVKVGDEIRHLPPNRHVAYSQALVKTLEPALKEVQAHVERASVIAAYSAREIVVKDFARDPDPNVMRRAGQAMARSLASNLCTAIVKEHLSAALRKHLLVLATHLTENPQTRTEITDMVASNNFDLSVRFLEYKSNELAGRKVEELLAPIVVEKTTFARKNEPLPLPADQVPLQPLLCTLPDALRPGGAMPTAQRMVYEDFFSCVPVVELLSHLIRTIEEAALRHYQIQGAEVLSLTNPQFTEKQLSEHHVTIRTKLVEVAHLITPETAVQLIGFVFHRLMDITENLTRIDVSRPETKPLVSTTQLLNEVFLFVIQSTNEKGKDKSLAELTRCYLNHDRRWKYGDVIVNFMRLRVIDVAKFDEALSKALHESQSSRQIVEFAGQVIQKVLIDDKLATTKDLHNTLQMLEQIARTRSQQQQQQMQQQQQQQNQSGVPPSSTSSLSGGPSPVVPTQGRMPTAPVPAAMVPLSGASKSSAGTTSSTPAAHSPYPQTVRYIRLKSLFPPERRAEIEPLFDEWIHICLKKSQLSSSADAAATESEKSAAAAPTEQTQVLSMQFVKKLQQTNMLLTDKNQLDGFVGILMELSAEHYATVALELERNAAANGGVGGGGSNATPPQAGSAGKGTAPPHRFPASPELFQKCDAFSDLVVLLVRCCSWSNSASGGTGPAAVQAQENTARAEVALVGRVLQVAVRVLTNNHEAIQNNAEGPPLQRPDTVYQRVFLQQPYVRVLSNLLTAIHRSHSENPSGPTDPFTTTEEILRFFSEVLRSTAPLRAPAFAFGWLECISHRLFVVRMLKNKKLWAHYVGLLCEALKFVEYFTKGASGVPSNVLVFTKSFLKLMLVLLHDFPEFVLSWHVQLCDAIPPCCVQLRNVVLCAFPQQIKLPDPFAQNLHIDRLPEMAQAPPVQEGYRKTMFAGAAVTMEDITAYVHSNPRNIPAAFPRTVLDALRTANGRWNVPLINAVVLHTACTHLALTQQAVPSAFADSPALELFRELARLLDNEGRYYLINACVNHLRYPNSHTHYFSHVVLHLFLPINAQHCAQLASHQEVIQEQVTRVLVERLIITRPHPWGLLITFIELIKNKRYCFWDKGFIRCTPEIEKMFDSLLKSISGSTTVAAAAAASANGASATTGSGVPAPPHTAAH